MDLPEALDATGGVVCAVGAGGKKSTLYALAGRIDRAVVTATVRIPIFDPHVARLAVTDDPVAAVEAADEWPVGVVPARDDRGDRYLGYDPGVVDRLADADADAVLVKADGARMREFKAPGDREPRIPASADTVLPVASVQAVGEPLDEAAVHRPERVAAVAGIEEGETIQPEHVAAVLADPRGGHKGVPEGATAIPVVNKVDDDRWADLAREVAAEVHARADVPRVVLAQMTAADPVVEVVEG